MKDKEKQNISMKEMLTKRSFEPITNCNCKVESRIDCAVKDKEKQIEEMAKDIPYLTLDRTVFVGATETKNVSWMLSEEDNKVIAEELIKKGWIKLPEDGVVLSADEFANLKKYAYRKGSKETVEKIICIIKTFSYDKEFTKIITRIIAERFGVEIKE